MDTKGQKIREITPMIGWLSLSPLHLSSIYHDLRDFSKAQSSVIEALELSQKSNERHQEGLSRIWMGRILGKKAPSKSIEAKKSITQGIKILEELKTRPWISQGYFFLGELYANTGQKDKALINLEKAKDMVLEMNMHYWPDKIQGVLDRL